MNRTPYVAKQSKTWFLKSRFYSLYMLRELTSIPVALYALNLMCGLASFVHSADAWQSWVNAQTTTIMLLFTVIAFAAALYHTVTWFQATPKILKIQLGEKFVPEKAIWLTHWIGFGVVALALVILIAYFA